jgi:hypothetical protein
MKAHITNGWLVVPCDAPDFATVHISWGRTRPGAWVPAFRDWRDGERVAQVRSVPPPGVWTVWVRVNDDVRTYHRITV